MYLFSVQVINIISKLWNLPTSKGELVKKLKTETLRVNNSPVTFLLLGEYLSNLLPVENSRLKNS